MLYKYLSSDSKSFEGILANQELYFAPPSMLNDPFEIMTNYIIPSKSKIKKYLTQIDVKRKDIKLEVPKLLQFFELQKTKLVEESKKNTDEYGILCLTPYCYNLLMWAHYGDSHKGICIGFDIALPHDNYFGNGHPVVYDETRPEICLIDYHKSIQEAKNMRHPDAISPESAEIVTKLLYSKSEHWDYEEEVRYIRALPLGGPGVQKLPNQYVKEIILGASISEPDIKRVKAFRDNNYEHAKIIKLGVSNEKYELEVKEEF